MSGSEMLGVAGAALSGLLTVIVALIAVIYRNDQRSSDSAKAEFQTRITALEKQNTEQETRIATIVANANNIQRDGDRIAEALGNLDKTQNAILQELTLQRTVLDNLSRRLSGQNIPATKLPSIR